MRVHVGHYVCAALSLDDSGSLKERGLQDSVLFDKRGAWLSLDEKQASSILDELTERGWSWQFDCGYQEARACRVAATRMLKELRKDGQDTR